MYLVYFSILQYLNVNIATPGENVGAGGVAIYNERGRCARQCKIN